MKFKVLVDNTEADDSRLQAEHGLSFWFEADGRQWLLDVGASSRFLENAELMGVSITEVEHLILSHAHADHTGGLGTFLKANGKADIWLSSHIDGRHFYSSRRGSKRDISIDYKLLEQYPERFHLLPTGGPVQISPSVALLTTIPVLYPTPKANVTLSADDAADDFSHETAVVVQEPEGITVLSSCSHLGILNTLHAASQQALTPSGLQPGLQPVLRPVLQPVSDAGSALRLRAYVGGLHLVNSDEKHAFETPAEIAGIAEEILTSYPDLTVYTGHCTGTEAIAVLQRVMGKRCVKFKTGSEYETLQ